MQSPIYTVVETVDEAVKSTDKIIDPLRKTGFKRFPTLFLFLTTFGATATFFGIERIIADVAWLDAHPFAILLLGMAVLAFTGRLYKRLS